MIADILTERAGHYPRKTFLRTDGGELSYAAAAHSCERLAGGLAGVGIEPGEPVVCLMGNSADLVLTWFALNRIGAVHVPVNSALIGAGLAHTLRVTGARVVVADAALLARLAAVRSEAPALRTVVIRGDAGSRGEFGGLRLVSLAELDAKPVRVPHDQELDPALMLFTSGTTGPSKACVLSHRYVRRQAELHAANLGFAADDVLYSAFPLFHLDAATLTVAAALAVGATAAIGRRFSASGFWAEARRFDATVMNFMGATLTMLWKQPGSELDRVHRVRLGWGVPMPSWRAGFEERFGFGLREVYGLTDGGIVAYDPADQPKRTGSCGRVIPEYEVAIGAADGAHLPAGQTGEILIRGREPGLVMSGYHGMPASTGFAGGWVRTGDLGWLDSDGYLYFRGRAKDVIRRRGENISAYEVEQGVQSHPAVLEAAAVAVPSELTEDDVKICVVLRPGASLTATELVGYCGGVLARHMVPRYVEFLPGLPKTPTTKVEKFRLTGITAQTWDRDATLRRRPHRAGTRRGGFARRRRARGTTACRRLPPGATARRRRSHRLALPRPPR